MSADPTPLSATARRFVRDWGGAAERWGLDRAAGEAHALLFLASGPLSCDDVASALSIDAPAADAALATLADWGLAAPAATGPDAPWVGLQDPVEMLRAVAAARRRREFDPAMTLVRDAVLRAESDTAADPAVVRRLEDLHEVMRLAQSFHTILGSLPGPETRRLLKLAQKIRQSLGG
ncbi:MAG: hypothetical protein HMLKMBBP_03618 [Planctomycetes bacterium]|nr:hypothetical protein [Planctomycetota bacterium]